MLTPVAAPLTVPATKSDDPELDFVPASTKNDKTDPVDQAFNEIQQKLAEAASRNPAARPGAPNTGTGGGQGGGNGTGKGTRNGPGTGTGGSASARPATRAQIIAERWNFTPTGSAKAHVEKFVAIGITLGFEDGAGSLYIIKNLKRRPADFQAEKHDKYKDTVMWANEYPPSVLALSNELGLPAPPRRFILLLPRDREQKMADEELRFTTEKRRDLAKVTRTIFDFRLKNGVYEPVAVAQLPFDPVEPEILGNAAPRRK